MSRSWTTISCRAFALCAALLGSAAARATAADKPPPPKLPLGSFWSIDLGDAASTSPVSDGDRVFVALTSADITARSVTDGQELWRIAADVTGPMAADGGLLFISAGEAIQAIRGADGSPAWIVSGVTTVAPLLVRGGWLIAVTDTEILAIRSKNGEIAWRRSAGGVRLQPDIDSDRVYTGAGDGRVLALTLVSGAVAWEEYLPLGVTSLAARDGRVYAGAGDLQFYCLDGKSGKPAWTKRIGSLPTGRISVYEERVYFTALDNVVRALDRANGNQRWRAPIQRRPIAGVAVSGHVVFVPAVAPQLTMLYDKDGRSSGGLPLPGEIPRDVPPDIRETPEGVRVFAVTGGLANEWQLTFFAPVDEAAGIVPLATLTALPGVLFVTDPVLEPIGKVLGELIIGDPLLRPVSTMGWPLVLEDPPLEPLTVLPGLPLRPLSPTLPPRSGG